MTSTAATADPVSAVREMRAAVADLHEKVPGEEWADAERVDALRSLEELKSAAAAAQARITAAFDLSQRAVQAEAGVRAARRGRGVAAQVALARRESSHRGQRHVGLAGVLVREMPHTLARLSDGLLTEWQATILAAETAVLTVEQRAFIDQELCADPATLDGLGDRGIGAAARRLGYSLDPAAAVRRASKAASDRRVTTRPMPDTMLQLSALLPVDQGAAVVAALTQAADAARAGGDPRGRGQVMADTLVQRTTGYEDPATVPVALSLVVGAGTLFGDPAHAELLHEPAEIPGYGPVPAGWARELLRRALARADTRLASTVRRLVTQPETGQVVSLDSRSRSFTDGLGDLIELRDAGICRTPWCGAPVRHLDHVRSIEAGGSTTESNGQGLCEACNYAKEAPGWEAHPRPGPGRHQVETTTPTGHTYLSTAPAPPAAPPGDRAPWSIDEGDYFHAA